MVLSNELKQEYHRVRTLHNFPAEATPFLANVTFQVKDGKAAEAQTQLTEVFELWGLDQMF